MAEFICNTSPLQYFHQLERMEIVPALLERVVIPSAVAEELEEGERAGWDVPAVRKLDWLVVREPASTRVLPLAANLGPGEAGETA